MQTGELLKLLKKNGITFVEHGTRHDMYHSPITGKMFPVPTHKDEVKTKTLNSILKDAGLK